MIWFSYPQSRQMSSHFRYNTGYIPYILKFSAVAFINKGNAAVALLNPAAHFRVPYVHRSTCNSIRPLCIYENLIHETVPVHT